MLPKSTHLQREHKYNISFFVFRPTVIVVQNKRRERSTSSFAFSPEMMKKKSEKLLSIQVQRAGLLTELRNCSCTSKNDQPRYAACASNRPPQHTFAIANAIFPRSELVLGGEHDCVVWSGLQARDYEKTSRDSPAYLKQKKMSSLKGLKATLHALKATKIAEEEYQHPAASILQIHHR